MRALHPHGEHDELAHDTHGTEYTKLHDFNKHQSDAKKYAKCSHTPNDLPPLLITPYKHDDKSGETIQWCTDTQRKCNRTIDDCVTVHSCVDIARLKWRGRKLLPEQIHGEDYAKKREISDVLEEFVDPECIHIFDDTRSA